MESLWSLLLAAEQERQSGRGMDQDHGRTENNNERSIVSSSSSASSSSSSSSSSTSRGDDGNNHHTGPSPASGTASAPGPSLGPSPGSGPSPCRGYEGLEYALKGTLLQQAHRVYATVPLAPSHSPRHTYPLMTVTNGANDGEKVVADSGVEERVDEGVCALESLWRTYDAWSSADVLAAHHALHRSFDLFNPQPTPLADPQPSSSSSSSSMGRDHQEGYEEEEGDVAVDDAAIYELSVDAAREGNGIGIGTGAAIVSSSSSSSS